MKRLVPVLLAALCLALVSALPSFAAEIDLAKAKATFESTCGKCHGIDRPLGVAGRDAAGWKETVVRMSGYIKDKFGAPLSADDQAAIVEYLVKRK